MEFLQNDQHIQHEHDFWTEVSVDRFVSIFIDCLHRFDQVFEELSLSLHSYFF